MILSRMLPAKRKTSWATTAILSPQRFAGNVVDIRSADGNAASVPEIETGQEMADRRLSAARGADERHGFPLFDGEGNAFQHRRVLPLSIFIAERHVVEDDIAVEVGFDGMFGLIFGGHIHQLAEALEARHAVLNLFKQRHQGAQRVQKHGDIENIRRKVRRP